MSELRVESNTPRLLEKGETPPDVSRVDDLPPEVPQRYWTPDKAQHVVAQVCRAGSKFYGPSVKAAEWELELIGDPAAAVLNDWLPLRTGASGDRTANLIALAAVMAILVLLRLPDILEVHGIITPWEQKQKMRGQPPAERDTSPPPAQAPPRMTVVDGGAGADRGRAAFDEQLVGVSGEGAAAGDDDKKREAIYGAQTVGGGGFVSGMEG